MVKIYRSFLVTPLLTLLALQALMIIATPGFAQESPSRVRIELDQDSFAAGSLSLSFRLFDQSNHAPLTDTDLSIIHEKKLHLFIYDPALTEFRHIHPVFFQNRWQVDTDLPRNGRYWIWAQGEIAADQEEFTASSHLTITSGLPANPIPPVLGESRSGSDGISQITLSPEKIKAGKAVILTIFFSRNDGTPPELTPYLGALAHTVGVFESGNSLTHVHPMNSSTPNRLLIHMTFNEVGSYRLWIQFVDGLVLKTVPLSVTVSK